MKYEYILKKRYYFTISVFIQNRNNELLQINKKYIMWTTTGGYHKSGETS